MMGGSMRMGRDVGIRKGVPEGANGRAAGGMRRHPSQPRHAQRPCGRGAGGWGRR